MSHSCSLFADSMLCCLQILLQSVLVQSHSFFKLLDHFVLEGKIGQSDRSEVRLLLLPAI